MPDPSPQDIEKFLETLSGLLGAAMESPDYSDLFAGEDPSVPGRIGVARPDEIEAALVMGLQRAEIALKQEAEEKRVAEQWSIVEGISQRNDAPPELPSEAQLAIVDRSALPDIQALASAAENAFQQLSAARGGPDEAFETATANALKALDDRDAGIARHHEAIATELERRKQSIAGAKQKFDTATQQISRKGQQILGDTNYKSPSVRALRNAMEAATRASSDLEKLTETASPDVFGNAVSALESAITEVEAKTGSVNNFAASETTKDRKELIAQLPSTLPSVAVSDLSMLAPGELTQTFAAAGETWKKSFVSLSKTAPSLSTQDFEDLYHRNVEEYLAAEAAADAIRNASGIERKRRGDIADQLRQARGVVKSPEHKLLEGTDEKRDHDLAEKAVATAMELVAKLRTTGLPQPFADAAEVAGKAIAALEKAGETSSDAAKKRADETTLFKKELYDACAVEAGLITSELGGSPATGIAAVMKKAFLRETGEKYKAIKGVNTANDQKLGSELKAVIALSVRLRAELAALPSSPYSAVAANVEITAGLDKLNKTLASPGIGETAITLANELVGNAFKVSKRYDEIKTLRLRYNEAIKDNKIEPKSQNIIKDFPSLEARKDSLTKGELTIQSEVFRSALFAIESRIAKNKETEAYLNSEAYKFVQLMENPGGQDVVGKLETLLADNTASRGAITQAYRSSWDHPDRFSVEVEVLIETEKDVVVHAHCANNGAPGAGNACHIKLWKYRFDPGGFALSNPLRALLPPSSACRSKAESAGLV